VGICARTVSMGVGSPFAIAMKMGWFKQEGLDVEIVPLPGSTDCVKSVATGQLLITLPSVEPLAIVRPQGIKAKIFHTAYQTNGYGLAVPADSPIQKAADLKGKIIGVTSLASAEVVVARAQVAAAGLDPDRDVHIVVAGEGVQPAALIRNRQIDALSQFYEDIDALVAAAHVEKEWMPDLSASMLRLSDTDRRGRRISGARTGRTHSPVSKTPWPGSRSRAISS
jgi:NitT/TauT family transport system substrate-binding protein